MKSFHCRCRQPLFFTNARCLKCGAEVAFDPTSRVLGALDPAENKAWNLSQDTRRPRPLFRFCGRRAGPQACNWLVPATSADTLCLSCKLTRTVPVLARPRNTERLLEIETAKRRVLFALLNLGLPVIPKTEEPTRGLAFDFLESLPDAPPVVTGHAKGLITLDIAEADDDYRARHRESLTEPYRTVVGHLRHELAHYYWDLLVRSTDWLPRFRELFGDETADYAAALDRHYREGPPPEWRTQFISAYASAHPWEDWAESWAHYLHMYSTLETAMHFGLTSGALPLRVDPFGPEVLYTGAGDADGTAFLGRVHAWISLTAVLNEAARSMGQPDLYPFVLNGPAVTKLHFVHCVIRDLHREKPAA